MKTQMTVARDLRLEMDARVMFTFTILIDLYALYSLYPSVSMSSSDTNYNCDSRL